MITQAQAEQTDEPVVQVQKVRGNTAADKYTQAFFEGNIEACLTLYSSFCTTGGAFSPECSILDAHCDSSSVSK